MNLCFWVDHGVSSSLVAEAIMARMACLVGAGRVGQAVIMVCRSGGAGTLLAHFECDSGVGWCCDGV